MKMNDTERKNWEETRKSGAFAYIMKTSLSSLILVVSIFFIGNGYVHRERLDLYLKYNLDTNLAHNSLTVLITYIGMLILTVVMWKISEIRYKKSLKQDEENEK